MGVEVEAAIKMQNQAAKTPGPRAPAAADGSSQEAHHLMPPAMDLGRGRTEMLTVEAGSEAAAIMDWSRDLSHPQVFEHSPWIVQHLALAGAIHAVLIFTTTSHSAERIETEFRTPQNGNWLQKVKRMLISALCALGLELS